METPLLNGAAEEGHGGGDGDYPPLRSWREVRSMVWTETLKLWRVAGPLAFQILCQFGTNSMTTVIVGHIGNLELSAVSISLSVIGTFSFGFMVSFLFSLSSLQSMYVSICMCICSVTGVSFLGFSPLFMKFVVAFDFSICPFVWFPRKERKGKEKNL